MCLTNGIGELVGGTFFRRRGGIFVAWAVLLFGTAALVVLMQAIKKNRWGYGSGLDQVLRFSLRPVGALPLY